MIYQRGALKFGKGRQHNLVFFVEAQAVYIAIVTVTILSLILLLSLT